MKQTEALKEIGPKVLDQVIGNLSNKVETKDVTKYINKHAFVGLFVWKATPEGFNYWSAVEKQLEIKKIVLI